MVNFGNVGIIGQGYVGLPLAMAAYKAGWNVRGFEIDANRISLINAGKSPVEDISDFEIAEALKSGRFVVSEEKSGLDSCDVVLICVPTPLNDEGVPDISILLSAVREVAQRIKPGALLINESTSFPGTIRKFIAPIIEEVRGVLDIDIACAPERVDPGNITWNQSNTPRLVGGLTKESLRRASEFYKSFCNQVVEVTSPEIAELAKLLENSFRQVNIALVNDLARLVDTMGVDVWEVISAAATKPYGFMKFNPSIGVGGHCIPVDPMYLAHYSKEVGSPMRLIDAAQMINNSQPAWISKKVSRLLGGSVNKKKIHLVGMGYKSGTSDVRESPSVKLLFELEKLGADCSWSDENVLIVNGSSPKIISSEIDLLVYCQTQESFDLKAVSELGLRVLDCTGTLNHLPNVVPI